MPVIHLFFYRLISVISSLKQAWEYYKHHSLVGWHPFENEIFLIILIAFHLTFSFLPIAALKHTNLQSIFHVLVPHNFYFVISLLIPWFTFLLTICKFSFYTILWVCHHAHQCLNSFYWVTTMKDESYSQREKKGICKKKVSKWLILLTPEF